MISIKRCFRTVMTVVVVSTAATAGCLLAAFADGGVVANAAPCAKQFAIVPGSFKMEPSTLQAGAHENLVTLFDFAHTGQLTCNDARNVIVNLPAGFIGNNTAVPTCTQGQLFGAAGINGELPACPPASAVGTISYLFGGERFIQPIYNMETTSFGVAAEYGFKFAHAATIQLLIGVRPGDSGITVTTPDIEKAGETREDVATIWGAPASHEHDLERQRFCEDQLCRDELGGPVPANIAVKPYLANPTSCGQFVASLRADSWETPEEWTEANATIGPIGECERVPFAPSIETQPTTSSAESPSGLNVTVAVPQRWDDPNTVATSDLKDAIVTLPKGMTINPSASSGLAACLPEQFSKETSSSRPGEGCPQESKIGSVEIQTPLISEKLEGAVYVATPFDNPFDSLLSFYIVAKIPDRGVVIKVAGEVHLDEQTGQITTTFLNNPQAPFSKFILKFHAGATAPLVSPPTCGEYTTSAALTPWSAPIEPRDISSPPFLILSGVRGGQCPEGGIPPLKPQVIAGTQNNAAGAYSPFYLRLMREDGEQEITKFTTTLPPGLSGNLTGIPFCSESAIEAARHKTGIQELKEPSCPAASELGHTIVAAGVGTVLAQTPGKIYLAGPYHGSTLSVVSITSAAVGPFDLGTVVIRFALRINPITAQVEIDSASSDPIPHIIEGVIVHVRDIHVYVDRSRFIINPTNCTRMNIANAITGAGADPSNRADQTSVDVISPFQTADCANLGFKPKFSATTSGKASRSNGTSFAVKLTYPKAPLGTQANIHSVKVDLPRQLPSRLTTLQKACADVVFDANPAACPAASKVGTARALTPIVPVPLVGPAYFVSHGGAKFPELIIVLQGYGIEVQLHGETFIDKKGITSSTYRTVPDQPVTSFELNLPQGHNSVLAANGNLCRAKPKVKVAFTAQNGLSIHNSIPITVTHCRKR